MQNRFGVILRLMKTGANNLFLYRYDAMPLFFKAFDDFMKGPDFLIETDEEILNAEIMKMSPTAKPLSEINGWDDSMRSESKKNPSLLKKLLTAITLGGHIIPSFMLKRKIAAFPPLDANMSSAFMHKRTIQYQLGSDYGFDFRRSFKRFFGNFFKCIGMAFRVLFKYGRVKKKYLEKKDYLSSFEFWKSHLEIE
jgi:galactofuranosylgalactofuranosylrhamnosyl-N-acetylglucosaminyl-diphospho-decaprenol beta-1,5/1,6-galactofuranosyltransferase